MNTTPAENFGADPDGPVFPENEPEVYFAEESRESRRGDEYIGRHLRHLAPDLVATGLEFLRQMREIPLEPLRQEIETEEGNPPMCGTDPKAWAYVRDWTHAGGNLHAQLSHLLEEGERLGGEPPFAFIVGDLGVGTSSVREERG